MDVHKVKAQDSGRVVVYDKRLNKNIELPYPEFNIDCIIIVANPIDLSFDDNGEIIGLYSSKENSRSCYFVKPYTKENLDYWTHLSEEDDDWVPFFPEQKELNCCDSGIIVSYYKDITFNKDWTPISHALYVNRINAQRSDDLDYLDLDIDRYEVIDVDDYESNESIDGYDVYATEFFGEFEEDDCEDECWACAKLLQKEMFYEVHVTTVKEGQKYKYTREVFGWDVNDVLDIALQSVAQAEQRNLYPSDIESIEVIQDGTIVFKN